MNVCNCFNEKSSWSQKTVCLCGKFYRTPGQHYHSGSGFRDTHNPKHLLSDITPFRCQWDTSVLCPMPVKQDDCFPNLWWIKVVPLLVFKAGPASLQGGLIGGGTLPNFPLSKNTIELSSNKVSFSKSVHLLASFHVPTYNPRALKNKFNVQSRYV